MVIGEDEFFREVTRRVCSSLDIQVAMLRTFDYLGTVIPLDELYLEILDDRLAAVRRIVRFSKSGDDDAEEIVPLPDFVWDWFMGLTQPLIMDSQTATGPGKAMVERARLKNDSDLALPLRIGEKVIGMLILRAYGKHRFNQAHADLLATVLDPFALALANVLSYQELIRYRDILLDDNRFLNRELLSAGEDGIIGCNAGLRNVMDAVRQVAPLNNTVLLLGETGTGKEVIANAIHFASARQDGPFIKVNCGAIPEHLIDSELFGHEKGAFTGAVAQKRGRFERAAGGTIFLDEIGELSLPAQVRLLRVLQTREIERVGGEKPVPVDIRVIAATHRNLESMVEKKLFREDLWFRLNVFPITVPPLRLRKEDVPALTRYFVESKSREIGMARCPAIAPGALDRLTAYSWPGNVRELENLVERELITHREGALKFDVAGVSGGATTGKPAGKNQDAYPLELDQAMALHINRVLGMTDGKIHGPGGAAELLGINPNTLRGRMKKLGIPFRRNG